MTVNTLSLNRAQMPNLGDILARQEVKSGLGTVGNLACSLGQAATPRVKTTFGGTVFRGLTLLRDAVMLSPSARAEKTAREQTRKLTSDLGDFLGMLTRPHDGPRFPAELSGQARRVLERAQTLAGNGGMQRGEVIEKLLARIAEPQSYGSRSMGLRNDEFEALGQGMLQAKDLGGMLRQTLPQHLHGAADQLLGLVTQCVQDRANAQIAPSRLGEALGLFPRSREGGGPKIVEHFKIEQTIEKFVAGMRSKVGTTSDADFIRAAVRQASSETKAALRTSLQLREEQRLSQSPQLAKHLQFLYGEEHRQVHQMLMTLEDVVLGKRPQS